jgi:hypothetical protein
MVVGEGIETTLSGMQIFDLPGWATISSSNMKRSFQLPPLPYGAEVIICVDRDDAGREAAAFLARRLVQQGRQAHLREPVTGDDMNDAWMWLMNERKGR